MPAIGLSLRKWTLLLLVCSIPTCAYSHSTDDSATVHPGATAASSTTTHHASSSPSPSSSRATTRVYTDSDLTCPSRTINYITHTLPQQCAKTSWSAPGEAVSTSVTASEVDTTQSPQPSQPHNGEDATPKEEASVATAINSSIKEAVSADGTVESGTKIEQPEVELETDSPLDNANFLSFEDWKKRNLAQVGQSPENVQGRAAPSNQPARRRPVNVNALDSLGDEAEIELDFSGFGTPPEGHDGGDVHARRPEGGGSTATDGDKKAAPSSWALSKDAGKTCKERFNYASFDCAATVLKTNKQAKSATSVLVENKDSYMLNVCSADNKFFIVELCDDILVDTVVLANYEFFSSMFRHFRVSVSDRYPVKLERWRTLATFEARNSRDIQPFLITEPQIWARYLRIEFLTHYGNEFYCPLSLLRVHGTTMMEQFRREEEESRGVDDDVDLEVTEADVVKPAIDSGPIPPDEIPVAIRDDTKLPETSVTDTVAEPTVSSVIRAESNSTEKQPSQGGISSSSSTSVPPSHSSEAPEGKDSSYVQNNSSVTQQTSAEPNSKHLSGNAAVPSSSSSTEATTTPEKSSSAVTSSTILDSARNTSTPSSSQSKSVSDEVASDAVPAKSRASRGASNNTAQGVQSSPQQRPSGTQPTPPAPSTQESFFKSIHKRLLYLEANSTLSLQYIEEQSRILRDAFVKVEKRQLAKTEKFLDNLNSTVMQELKSFRTMYDQLWQSTVIELESMKDRQKSEMTEIGARLTLMADELVWQKRMAVVQSTLLLLCLGLVLFVRSGTLGSTADVPIVQQLGNKYSSLFESSPPRSPPESGIAKRRRTFKDMWRSDTSAGLSDPHSDGQNVVSDAETEGARSPVQIAYSPPTPDTPSALAQHDLRNGINHHTDDTNDEEDEYPLSQEISTPTTTHQSHRLDVLETQSGPATPNGTRDSRPSWEEVDRAIDQLKKAEQEQQQQQQQGASKSLPLSQSSQPSQQPSSASQPSSSSSTSTSHPPSSSSRRKRDTDRSKKRSPLRRSYGSFEVEGGDDEGGLDSGGELFL